MKTLLFLALFFPTCVFADCVATTTYSSCNAGYEMVLGNCVACSKGYYNPTAGASASCTKCPPSGKVLGLTASTASVAKTDCYIPANSNLSDTAGAYTFTSNCGYTN